jgi:uncharacterized protein with HEPN domain
MRDPGERLRDMLEAVENIERYAIQGKENFESDELVQNWIVHHLQIMCEAARGMPKDIMEKTPYIPWTKMTGMRNILVHYYFRIDTEIVWQVVERDLPNLKELLQTMLKEL